MAALRANHTVGPRLHAQNYLTAFFPVAVPTKNCSWLGDDGGKKHKYCYSRNFWITQKILLHPWLGQAIMLRAAPKPIAQPGGDIQHRRTRPCQMERRLSCRSMNAYCGCMRSSVALLPSTKTTSNALKGESHFCSRSSPFLYIQTSINPVSSLPLYTSSQFKPIRPCQSECRTRQ